MSKEELSSSVSSQLFNGETQLLTVTLENIGAEDIETLEVTSKMVSTKGERSKQSGGSQPEQTADHEAYGITWPLW